ncbi:hypothetical protein FQR65_LT20326 [Abscondita terminalis]|nr:hypothetical protein FQR65_LT20326 [Abscondita terminalis]
MKAAVLACALFASSTALPALAADADPAIAKQLKALGYEYEVDEDGDYKLLMATGDDDERSQIVFVRSAVETYGNLRVRELWSYAYKSPSPAFSAGENAVYVAKILADANAKTLEDSIAAAAHSADAMEIELADDPTSDDF